MKISVVINTLNRADYIVDTLNALLMQTYSDFEILIVNGPSIDNTKEIIATYLNRSNRIKYFETSKNNLSISRNIGIKHATGEIVTFIDDDAIPGGNWMQEIVDYFQKNQVEKIGALGGIVYSEDKKQIQFKQGYVGVWGEVHTVGNLKQNYNDPKGYYFNTVMGTNASFNRKALVVIGGFDEEIEYFHDESDVCVRLIKAGYKVVGVENASVVHRYAPSAIRKTNLRYTNWNTIAKNRVYFAIKNSKDYAPLLLRLIKPLTLEVDKFPLIFKEQGRLINKIFASFCLLAFILKGYFRGHFARRKLIAF